MENEENKYTLCEELNEAQARARNAVTELGLPKTEVWARYRLWEIAREKYVRLANELWPETAENRAA